VTEICLFAETEIKPINDSATTFLLYRLIQTISVITQEAQQVELTAIAVTHFPHVESSFQALFKR